jgi:hypothetical protein
MAVAVAADRQRVDRIHLLASRHQRADQPSQDRSRCRSPPPPEPDSPIRATAGQLNARFCREAVKLASPRSAACRAGCRRHPPRVPAAWSARGSRHPEPAHPSLGVVVPRPHHQPHKRPDHPEASWRKGMAGSLGWFPKAWHGIPALPPSSGSAAHRTCPLRSSILERGGRTGWTGHGPGSPALPAWWAPCHLSAVPSTMPPCRPY